MKIVVMFLSLLIVECTYAASFDCGGKLNDVEKMICSNAQLSGLDDELGALYKYMHVNNAEKQEQLNWIKERNKCKNLECVASSYKNRIDVFVYYRLPIKTCISSENKFSEFAKNDKDNYFYFDNEYDLNGDESNELIYVSGGCNAHCMYAVYALKNGCYHEIASFSAREYFVVSPNSAEISEYISKEELEKHRKNGDISSDSFSCLLINDVEPMLDGATGPQYKPWCFDKK
jgi:uncharacterized protein YecT (DUF1311 family)